MSEIKEVCRELGIYFDKSRPQQYSDFEPDSEDIIEAITSLSQEMDNRLILYGGQATHSELLGYRKMRLPSNDIDCVTDKTVIEKTLDVDSEGEPIFYEPFDAVMLEYEEFPTVFVVNQIHDWDISSDFTESKVNQEVRGTELNLVSPEYNIMLKLRRANEEGELWGKDKTDISNLLLAPLEKNELQEINYSKLTYLLREHVTDNRSKAKYFLGDLREFNGPLRNEEEIKLQEELDQMEKRINQMYGFSSYYQLDLSESEARD